MNRFFILILCIAFIADHVYAQQPISGHILRVDAFAGFEGIEFDNGVEDDSMAGFGYGGSLAYQSPWGLYGHIGDMDYAMSSLKTFDYGIAGINEKVSEQVAGLGYRFRLNESRGIYLGLGYARSRVDWEDSTDSFNSAKLFLQKEEKQRYGIISLSHNKGDNIRSLSIDGKYIWFFGRSDWGMGLSWTIAEGEYSGFPEDLDVKQRTIGAVVSYQPTFGP